MYADNITIYSNIHDFQTTNIYNHSTTELDKIGWNQTSQKHLTVTALNKWKLIENVNYLMRA